MLGGRHVLHSEPARVSMMVDVTVHQEIHEHRLSLEMRFWQAGHVDKHAMLFAKHLPPLQVARF